MLLLELFPLVHLLWLWSLLGFELLELGLDLLQVLLVRPCLTFFIIFVILARAEVPLGCLFLSLLLFLPTALSFLKEFFAELQDARIDALLKIL